MQTEHLSDELLQRHFDGDLDRAEAVQAQAHLDACGVCAKKRARLARLSGMIAQSAKEPLAEANFAGLFERIERGIESERAADTGARVISLASRRRPAYATVSAVVAGFAAAAAVLLMVYRPSKPTLPDAATPRPAQSETAEAAEAAPPLAALPSHSEVVSVDFGDNAGTVFDIALADGSSTPVVWINDDE